MNPNHRYLIVRPVEVLRQLERLGTNHYLPSIPVDRVFGDMVQALQTYPHLTGTRMDECIAILKTIYGLDDIYIDPDDYDEVGLCFTTCLIHLREDFRWLNVYESGKIPYVYKERRGTQSVVLERIPVERATGLPYLGD